MKKPAFPKKSKGRTGSGAPDEAAFAAAGPAGSSGGTKTTQSLLAAAAVLAVVFGVAQVRPPATAAGPDQGGAATSAQVERTALVCPQPLQGLTGSTTLTAYTPPGTGTGGDAAAGVGWVADAAAPATAPSAPAAPAPSAPAPSAPTAAASTAPVAAKDTAPGDAPLNLTNPGAPVV
ncbi:hypothetical protein ACFVXQ_25750, partial [Kitasatospora sp. NPDC058263]